MFQNRYKGAKLNCSKSPEKNFLKGTPLMTIFLICLSIDYHRFCVQCGFYVTSVENSGKMKVNGP